MIMIGTFNWPKTIAKGDFYCPQCESRQPYRHRSIRPFVTLYFVPIIPIGKRQEFVECEGCKMKFEPDILQFEQSSQSHSFEQDLAQAVALTMLEDGQVTEREVETALGVMRVVGQMLISREELGGIYTDLMDSQLTLTGLLWSANKRRSREELLRIVQAVFLVAGADGEISSARMAALIKAKDVLGLSAQEFENCIVQAEQIEIQNLRA